MRGLVFRQEDLSYPLRVVFVLAAEEARILGHNYTTGHCLLALLRHKEGVAARALRNLGVTYEGVGAEVDELLGCGEKVAPDAEPALREALAHDYTGTEQLLLALLRHKEGVAARALERLGVSLEGPRAQELHRALERAKAESREGHRAPSPFDFLRDLWRVYRSTRTTNRRIALEWALSVLIPVPRWPVGKSLRDWRRTPVLYRQLRSARPPYSRREALEFAVEAAGITYEREVERN